MQEINQDTQERNQYQESVINALTVENYRLKEENGAAKQLLISVFHLLFASRYVPATFLLIFIFLISFIVLIESTRVF